MARRFSFGSWGLLLAIFAACYWGVIVLPDANEQRQSHLKMLAATTEALQKTVIYSHFKYFTATSGKGVKLNGLELDGKGLDYNEYGFPVGTEHTPDSLSLPVTAQHCRDLWNALLVTMQPMLVPAPSGVLEVKAYVGSCIFRSIQYPNMAIVYNTQRGSVQFMVAEPEN